MLCIDNSEYSRNGDYSPSRFQSSVEACSLLASHKLQSNPETSVGLLSMAGSRVSVHVSPCRSNGSIMAALSKEVRISGQANLSGALKTAALALKNRQNKNQRQRIIAFVGSPVDDDVSELVRLAKALKKNNVSVDLINFGAENASNENPEKLEQFIAAVKNAENSHLVNVPPGPHILADLILSSPICVEAAQQSAASRSGQATAAGAAAGAGAGAGMGMDAEIDPNLDPEMAMAIRMSYEEERQRQLRMQQSSSEGSQTQSQAQAQAQPANPAPNSEVSAAMEDDDEALLAQAIALSMQQENQSPSQSPAQAQVPPASSSSAPASSADVDMSLMQDPDFLSSLLQSVGANPNPDGLNNLLSELSGSGPAPGDNKTEEKKDDKTNEKK